ncbi:MAG TPA: hypothetical protein VGF13_19920 [Verrucomicrobiae bacterium]
MKKVLTDPQTAVAAWQKGLSEAEKAISSIEIAMAATPKAVVTPRKGMSLAKTAASGPQAE